VVYLQVSSFEADHGYADGRVMEYAPETVLGLSQRIFVALALGDVTHDTGEQPFPILVCLAKGHFEGELTTIFAQPHELSRATHYARFAGSQVSVQACHTKVPVSFGHNQRDRSADDFFRTVTEDALRPAVEPLHHTVRRYAHDRVEGCIKDCTIARLALS
jgi:hypothetical protein